MPRSGRRGRHRRQVEIDGVLISTQPDAHVARLLEERIIAFNIEATGIDDALPLTGAVRSRTGQLIGGTHGWSWGGTCWIESLWVQQEVRGRGVGSALLRFAEREARTRRCHQLALDTHSFQAPDFYLRHGFQIVGSVDGYPVGHQRLVMRKVLGPSAGVTDDRAADAAGDRAGEQVHQRADETTADQTAADQTAADQTAADQTAADQTAADQTMADQTMADETGALGRSERNEP